MSLESRIGVSGLRGRRRACTVLAILLLIAAVPLLLASPAAAVAVTVPYSAAPVADADLDGNPGTGAWSDAVSAAVPLENGEAGAYGTATLYAKHDGTTLYFRLDGSVDVPWTSATGNHFWLGFAVSPGTGGHHGGGTWDGWYFGLWDGADYAPQPTYPPPGVDTNGFGRPPPRDATQNLLGRLRYSGAAAPYAFTAEWKRALSTGDASDVAFVADGAATYYFYVTTDSDGRGSSGGAIDHASVTNSNTLRFAAPPGNTAPIVDLTTPDGLEVWTGSSSHLIRWNMSDAETPATSLRVWINYSTDGGASYLPIPGAQGVSGFSNPCTYPWTVPAVNTVQARVRVTVADAQRATSADASLANFAIDSSAPSMTGVQPPDLATGVNPSTQVRATFSEAMNRPSAESAFSLMRLDTSTYVAGTFAWAGNDLAFTPSGPLAQGIVYRVRVNATARDASDPGNPMAGPFTSTFTTADVTPPSIASATAVPSPQEIGGTVNVSASVTDNGAVAEVWIQINDPGGAPLSNATAAFDAGAGRYFRVISYTRPGTYTFRISARDAAGNWAVATGNFALVDTQPPVIQHTPVTQAVRNAPIRITAIVSDVDSVLDARLDYTDVLGARSNVSMALNGTTYEYDIPGQPVLGTLTYFVWARDPTGNAARTPLYSVSIVGSDTTPPVVANAQATPAVQNASFAVNLTATVTDNVAVQSVSVEVRGPSSTLLGNFTMARLGATDGFYFERTYTTLGLYTAWVWATDTSGNNATAATGFEIWDRMPPTFLSVGASPPAQGMGLPVNITASVTDNVAVAGVRVQVLDPSSAVVLDTAMAGSSGSYWQGFSSSTVGTFTFTLTASDPSANTATDGGSFTVLDTEAPIAVAGPDVTVGFGATVAFDGSASRDNVAVVNFTWSLTDGGPVVLYGAAPSRVFANIGSFLVTLTVMDAASNTGTDTMWVNVTADSAPPVANAGPGQTVLQGSLATLDGGLSSDDTGIDNYTWTFTDGAPVVLWGPVVTHRFTALGNHTVTLTVEDLVGNTDSNATWVEVVPDPEAPVARAGPDQTITLGQTVALDGSQSTDNVGIVNYTWRVDRTAESLYGVAVSYRPGAGGIWRFVLTVADASALTSSDDLNVTVIVVDTTPPGTPLGLTARTGGPREIRVNWTPNAEPDLDGYLLFRAEASAGPFIRLNADPLRNVTYSDAGLAPGQRYWYVVRAVDTAGNPSGDSGPADAVAGLAPAAPFDWNSLRWALVPISVGVVMALLAFAAWRAQRRAKPEPVPKTEPESKAPPPS